MHEIELKEELPLLNTYGFNVSLTEPNNQIPNDLSDEMRIFYKDPKPIYDETLHKTWLHAIDQKCLIDDWISRFNKMIFNYIQRKINEAKKLKSWDEGNIWNRPNKEFVNWFHIEGFEQKYVHLLVTESAAPARIAPEGAGTIIVGFTGSAGWKHYYKKSKLSFYSVLSGQGVVNFGFSGFISFASFALEYTLTRKTTIKMGFSGMALLMGGTSDGHGGDIGVLPFVGLNFRF